jgi:biopolymer transport protein ExbD
MVTAPILHQGVSVNLPRVKAGPLSGEEVQLVVSVTAQGAVYLNDALMTPWHQAAGHLARAAGTERLPTRRCERTVRRSHAGDGRPA